MVDQVETNIIVCLWCYYQSGVTELLIMRDPPYGRICQLKTSGFSILSCEKGLGLDHFTAENLELRGLYPFRQH